MALKKGQPIPKAAKCSIVTEVAGLDWSKKPNGKESTYLNALLEIQKNPGKVVCVEKLSARGAILSQAKKHHLKIVFAEKDGKLYVKVIGETSPEECMLQVLKGAPAELSEISLELEKAGFADVNVKNITSSLSNSQIIILETGAGGIKKWRLTSKGVEYVEKFRNVA